MSDALSWDTASAAIATFVMSGSGLDASHVFWAYEGRPRPSAPYIEMTIQQVRSIGHDWTMTEDNTLTFAPLVVSAVSTGADTLTATAHGRSNGDGPVQLDSSGTLPAPLASSTDYWLIVVDANTLKLADSYVHTGGQQPLGVGNPVTPIDLTTTGSGSITISSTADTVPAGREIIRRAQGFREMTIHFECFAQEGKGYDAMRILSNVVASIQLNLYALDEAGVGVSDFGQSFSQGGIQHLEGHRGSILEPRSMFDLTVYLASNLVGFDTIVETVSGELDLDNQGTTLPPIPFTIPPA